MSKNHLTHFPLSSIPPIPDQSAANQDSPLPSTNLPIVVHQPQQPQLTSIDHRQFTGRQQLTTNTGHDITKFPVPASTTIVKHKTADANDRRTILPKKPSIQSILVSELESADSTFSSISSSYTSTSSGFCLRFGAMAV